MKILQISAVYKKGSVGKIVDCIHTRLLENGHDSFVCYGIKNSDMQDKRIICVCNKLDILLSKIRYAVFGLNLKGSFFGTRRIIKNIKRIKPDVVHIHCVNDFYLNQLALFKFLKKNNIKTVITMHCEHYYTGNCGYALKCDKWKTTGCDNHCYQFHSSSHLPLVDRSKRMFKREIECFKNFKQNNLHFCVCTPWLRQRASESLILKRFSNFSVVFNGADTNIYTYNNDATESDRIVISYVTPRFDDPTKGSTKINELAKLFLDDKRYVFKLIGTVPNNYHFEKNIVLLGPKYGKELAKEYSSADVNIMLSESECFPMVVVESLLCGTKVVAFKCGGPDNCFTDDMATFVEQNDFTSMKEAIIRYTERKYDKKALSKKSASLYGKNIMADNYINCYENFLKS